MGQPCCDQLLTNIWHGKIQDIQSTGSKHARLLIGIGTFGLLAPMLVPFREDTRQPASNGMTRSIDSPEMLLRLKDYGINYSASDKSILTYIRHLKHFHESPMVKYAYNSISYLLFLLLFCYYLLFNFEMVTNDKPMIHWTEILVIIMVTIMLIEEIRQVSESHRGISPLHTTFFVVHLSRESIDRGQIVELLHKARFLQFYPSDIVRPLLRGSYPAFDQHRQRTDIFSCEDCSRLRSRDLVHSFVRLSRHRSEDGTETGDDPQNGNSSLPPVSSSHE